MRKKDDQNQRNDEARGEAGQRQGAAPEFESHDDAEKDADDQARRHEHDKKTRGRAS